MKCSTSEPRHVKFTGARSGDLGNTLAHVTSELWDCNKHQLPNVARRTGHYHLEQRLRQGDSNSSRSFHAALSTSRYEHFPKQLAKLAAQASISIPGANLSSCEHELAIKSTTHAACSNSFLISKVLPTADPPSRRLLPHHTPPHPNSHRSTTQRLDRHQIYLWLETEACPIHSRFLQYSQQSLPRA